MERVFTELTPECEITARMYAQGYEKKEIANFKCRAVSTINNQLQKAFEILHVRNGRELATMLYETDSRCEAHDGFFAYSPCVRRMLLTVYIFFVTLPRTR